MNSHEIKNAFFEFVEMPTQLTCADLFRSVTKDHFLSLSDSAVDFARYNEETTLWETLTKATMVKLVQRTMQHWAKTVKPGTVVKDLLKENDDIDTAKEKKKIAGALSKLHALIGTHRSVGDICQALITEYYDEEKIEKLDSTKDCINFRNGMLDLRHHSFRQRTAEDYVTRALEWDYHPKPSKKATSKVKEMMMHTCNDDEDFFKHIMSVMGYCLTGHTDLQSFFSFLGASAGNGKSTTIEILETMFPFHVLKLDSRTFNENYGKQHKQLIKLHKLVRICYIEELSSCKLDVNLLKDFVSGNKLNVEVMYGTCTDVMLLCKLIVISNSLPKFAADRGIKRRGVQSEFRNQFVPPDEYAVAKKKAPLGCNVYKYDLDIKQWFRDDEMKLAMLHLILPWTKYYYENRTLYDMKTHTDAWKETVDVNDPFKEFLDDTIEITDDENDRISKVEFVEMYNQFHGTKIGSNTLLNYLKANGIRYEKNWRHNGFRGVVIGVKILGDDDEEVPKKKKASKKTSTKSDSSKDLDANVESVEYDSDAETELGNAIDGCVDGIEIDTE